MTIKYAGPMLDYSGYGQASRHHIAAFDAAGVNVIGQLLSYSSENADYGSLGPLMHKVRENKGHYNIKLLHTTPDEFKQYIEPAKYNIGFCYWETDRIPDVFADGLNLVNEIWTGSQANFDAIRKAGVEKPIKIFPEPMETDLEWPAPYKLPDFDGFVFYSVMEWIDRKNPQGLVRAFLEEFTEKDNVCLLLKTYFRNFAYINKKTIRNQISMLRSELGKSDKVPIYLYLDLMDRKQILRLHQTGDCFVSAHRGEGWGVPQVEAMLAGNPIISTAYGGVHEYLDESNAYLIPYEMTQLKGMEHSQHFYTANQNWAEPDIKKLRSAMRQVYENQDEAKSIGRQAKQLVRERFNLKRVGSEMLDRLNEIEKGL